MSEARVGPIFKAVWGRGPVVALVLFALFSIHALFHPATAAAQLSGPMPKDIGYEPHLGGRVPLDLELVDDAGRRARLGDYFNGKKPVILVLAYYECPMLCSMVLNGLTEGLKGSDLSPGADFEVVVVSIDPADTPERAGAKKASYVKLYDRPGAESALHFMTGTEAGVQRLADAVGFSFAYDPVGRQFAHAAGIVLLTGEGMISRYLYGVDFAPRDLRLGLVEAGNGAIGTVKDRLMLLCFRYDPERGRYGGLALASVRTGGVLTLVALGFSLFAMRRRPGRGGPPEPERKSDDAA